jgi:beta-lactamase class A
MLFVYLRPKDPLSSTYIVAPVHATSTVMDADAALTGVGRLPLINPGVTANLGKHFIINFKPLETSFKATQARYKQKTFIYFVYLNNAAWIGENESALFTAASTIKVPLAMAIVKMAEEGKLSLSQSYTLDQLDLDSNFGDLYKVGPDNSFTLQELIQIMLENSDNTAMNALIKVAHLIGVSDPFADVYAFMGWGASDFGKTPTYNLINLKTLSNMFIALYNAKYDDLDDSQLVLSYLDNSTFTDQIVSGAPANIPVAQKFGVNAADKTYSDCGIVYAPNRNFLICLGIVGSDQKTANSFMKEITSAAYEYVIKN